MAIGPAKSEKAKAYSWGGERVYSSSLVTQYMLGGGTSAISRTVDGCGVGAAQLGKSPAAITTGHKSFPLSSHRRRHTTSQPQPWLVPRLVSNTECDTTTEHTAAADKTCNRVFNAGQIPAVLEVLATGCVSQTTAWCFHLFPMHHGLPSSGNCQ